ncbi:unnamed protein product, partial [Staurois parvus]
LQVQTLSPPSCPGQFLVFSTITLNDNCAVMQHSTHMNFLAFFLDR